jgi:hypothetical protein
MFLNNDRVKYQNLSKENLTEVIMNFLSVQTQATWLHHSKVQYSLLHCWCKNAIYTNHNRSLDGLGSLSRFSHMGLPIPSIFRSIKFYIFDNFMLYKCVYAPHICYKMYESIVIWGYVHSFSAGFLDSLIWTFYQFHQFLGPDYSTNLGSSCFKNVCMLHSMLWNVRKHSNLTISAFWV